MYDRKVNTNRINKNLRTFHTDFIEIRKSSLTLTTEIIYSAHTGWEQVSHMRVKGGINGHVAHVCHNFHFLFNILFRQIKEKLYRK